MVTMTVRQLVWVIYMVLMIRISKGLSLMIDTSLDILYDIILVVLSMILPVQQ